MCFGYIVSRIVVGSEVPGLFAQTLQSSGWHISSKSYGWLVQNFQSCGVVSKFWGGGFCAEVPEFWLCGSPIVVVGAEVPGR